MFCVMNQSLWTLMEISDYCQRIEVEMDENMTFIW